MTRALPASSVPRDAAQPAYYVPKYAQKAGYVIVPIPVYYLEVTEILGERVYRNLADVPGDVDMVTVFRRSRDLAPHLNDISIKKPKAVWLEIGIRDDVVAERLARADIDVVQDGCLMVELRRHGR